jgi:hypothetical protein
MTDVSFALPDTLDLDLDSHPEDLDVALVFAIHRISKDLFDSAGLACENSTEPVGQGIIYRLRWSNDLPTAFDRSLATRFATRGHFDVTAAYNEIIDAVEEAVRSDIAQDISGLALDEIVTTVRDYADNAGDHLCDWFGVLLVVSR